MTQQYGRANILVHSINKTSAHYYNRREQNRKVFYGKSVTVLFQFGFIIFCDIVKVFKIRDSSIVLQWGNSQFTVLIRLLLYVLKITVSGLSQTQKSFCCLSLTFIVFL